MLDPTTAATSDPSPKRTSAIDTLAALNSFGGSGGSGATSTGAASIVAAPDDYASDLTTPATDSKPASPAIIELPSTDYSSGSSDSTSAPGESKPPVSTTTSDPVRPSAAVPPNGAAGGWTESFMVEGWLESQGGLHVEPAARADGADPSASATSPPLSGIGVESARKIQGSVCNGKMSNGSGSRVLQNEPPSGEDVKSLVAKLRASKGGSGPQKSAISSTVNGAQVFEVLGDHELSERDAYNRRMAEKQEREAKSLKQRQQLVKVQSKKPSTKKKGTRSSAKASANKVSADRGSGGVVGAAASNSWSELCELESEQRAVFSSKIQERACKAEAALSKASKGPMGNGTAGKAKAKAKHKASGADRKSVV